MSKKIFFNRWMFGKVTKKNVIVWLLIAIQLQIFQGIFQWKKFLNRLRIDKIMIMSLWPRFSGPSCMCLTAILSPELHVQFSQSNKVCILPVICAVRQGLSTIPDLFAKVLSIGVYIDLPARPWNRSSRSIESIDFQLSRVDRQSRLKSSRSIESIERTWSRVSR